MRRPYVWKTKGLGLVIVLGSVACGGGRELVGINVSPGSADAQNSGGQVQFTAMGTFSQSPKSEQLGSSDVGWCMGSNDGTCNGNISSGATVDSNGLAQCQPNFQGTATVLAGKAKSTQVNPDGPYPLRIFGMAQLTCP
jgi:hypothetical protein